MLPRMSLLASRAVVARRMLHKGVDSTPPIRFISNGEKIGLYFAIAITFLSYPTYVMLNLDNLRPKDANALSEEVQSQIDEIRARNKA